MWCGIVLAGSLLAGCNALLTVFAVPNVVGAGRTFVITVAGAPQGTNSGNGSNVGCVLQMPAGFTAVARGPGIADEPGLLQRYTPEPGYQLVSQSAFVVNVLTASTHFVLRAPATPGTFAFKVSIAGYNGTAAYQAVDPPGVTNFAQIVAPPHVRQIVVQPSSAEILVVEPAVLPPGSGTFRLVDVDRDGMDDVVRGRGPEVWLARPGNTWINRSPATGLSASEEVAVGDFDGDGHLDLAHGSRRIFYGDGLGNWTQATLQPSTPNTVSALGAGDYDGDGRDDILECDSTGWVRCLRSLPGRTYQSRSFGLPGVGSVQTQLAFADIDGDGNQDIVGTRACWRGSAVGTWTNLANGLYQARRFAIGNVFGDARPEVVLVPATVGQAVDILFMSIAGMPTVLVAPFGTSQLTYAAAQVSDLDGDGTNEILLASNGIEVWHYPAGIAVRRFDLGLPDRLGCSVNESPAAGALMVGDLDGDGRPELIATSGIPFDWAPLLWRNFGTGVLSYGTACTAPGLSTPGLGAVGMPQLGSTSFALDLTGGQPNSTGILWLGLSRHTRLGQPVLPLPLASFGAPGCTLLAEDLAVHLLPLDAAGATPLPLPLPNVPALRYVSVFAQGAVLAPGANPLGLLTSAALAIRLQ